MLDSERISESEVETIDKKAFETVENAAEEAMTYPEPDPTHMEDEVYAP